ncbi:hypothetical protein G7Z17_g13041 [Cylindrodendrum hubeiense]|uniref:Uncharacterized protein n=1 Tax=Cylindrodendrum hubeiense TaxID=595255 RepID=A0A9P5L9Z8_9HYPO|nr:hypothetical protein G7Z17_g13041 [Cylindrodendrum hubeiense]
MSVQSDLNTAWERDCAAHEWGFIAADVDDPPHCVSECRERFLRAMLPKDETFGRLCEVFEDRDHMDKEQPFRFLYCCDSQLCGVDNLAEIGKDHPGPPDSTYTCSHDSAYEGDSRCQKESPYTVSDDVLSSESVANSPTASPAEYATPGGNAVTETLASTSASVTSPMPEQTYSRITDPSLGASMDPSDVEGKVENERGLTTGVKVTIGLTTIIAIAIIATLAICLLRRRSRKGDIRGKIKHPSSPAPAGSPTPLVSPALSHAEADGVQLTTSHTDANGVQLTPPARLRERRLLPTLMNQRFSQSGKSPNLPGFPMSPLYSPTTGRLTPRHERTPKIRNGVNAVAVPRIVMTAPDGGWMNQEKYPSALGRESPTSASNAGPQVGYNNGSPTRHPRSHERIVNIPELISPGPPPNRALPSTPPNGSRSPTSIASRPDDADVAYGVSLQHPAQLHALSQDSQELCDMTEDYARESHNSWGSWGGGGPGVSVSSLNKGRSTRSPAMEEAELERLGGRY